MNPPDSIPFDSLTPADQRRAIACDIIAQLDTKRLVAAPGIYLAIKGSQEQALTKTLREMARESTEPCKACAIGSIMLAQLNVNGDCPVKDLLTEQGNGYRVDTDAVWVAPWGPTCEESNRTPSTFSPFATRYFTMDQLILIEVAFELGSGALKCVWALVDWRTNGTRTSYDRVAAARGITTPIEQAEAAFQFGHRYDDPEARLRAIMEAVVNHPEGLFTP